MNTFAVMYLNVMYKYSSVFFWGELCVGFVAISVIPLLPQVMKLCKFNLVFLEFLCMAFVLTAFYNSNL